MSKVLLERGGGISTKDLSLLSRKEDINLLMRGNMSFQIGQTVQLNGKDYKITGTHAKSFLLERDGKIYKATADKLAKIQNQNTQKQSSVLDRRLAYQRLFNKDAKLPETEAEFEAWFEGLRGELSPENLCCDGEASRSQINNKLRDINACWAELENRLGRKVAK